MSGLNPLHLTRRGTAGAADSSRQSSKYPATIYGNAIRSRTRLSYSGSKPLNSPQPKHLDYGAYTSRVECAGYRCGSRIRAFLGCRWRFPKLGRIQEDVLRLRIVGHRLCAELCLYLARFAIVIGRCGPIPRASTQKSSLLWHRRRWHQPRR